MDFFKGGRIRFHEKDVVEKNLSALVSVVCPLRDHASVLTVTSAFFDMVMFECAFMTFLTVALG